MATAAIYEDESEGKTSLKTHQRYVCPICLEPVKTPRSLPCLHSFCEECLQTFITAAFGKSPEDVSCPVCRKQIVAPESGLSHDKWAKSFPFNYYLSASLLVSDQSTSNAKCDDENCQACERSNKLAPAYHYCKNCEQAVCETCKQMHNNFPILNNHVIVTLEFFRKNPSIPDRDEMCQHHPSKVVEVYCLDHSKMCCSVCFATKHRHCKDVKSIEECAEDLSEDVFNLITMKLKSMLEPVEEEIKNKENIGKKRRKCKYETVVKMTQYIEAAKKNLDILLQKFESDLDRQDSTDDLRLQNILKILHGIKTSVVGDIQMLETAQKYGSKTQVFVALEKVKIQMGEQLKQMSDVASGSPTEGYTVDFQKLEEVCKLENLASVQPVLTTSQANVTQVTNGITDFCMNYSDFIRRQHLFHLEPHMIHCVEKWTYKLPCKAYGVSVFGEKIAVVTQEKKIVMFNEDGRVLFQHTIPYSGSPADIYYSGHENNFFISFQKEKILNEYLIDNNKITELSQISLQGVAEGFFIVDDKIVHASKDYIYISSRNGGLRESIQSNSKGNIAFLAGCLKQQAFYHIDDTSICIRKISNITANKIPLLQHTQSPRGLGIDFQGNVYVCCFDTSFTKKLLQISHKDNKVRVVLDVSCYTIAFHPDGMSFVLIDYNGNLRFYTLSDSE